MSHCTCHSRSLEPCAYCSAPADEPEHVATILPRALREIRGPSRRPRPDVAPLVDSQCRKCRTIWRTETRVDQCPSCRKEAGCER